jgi:hypothetical protein
MANVKAQLAIVTLGGIALIAAGCSGDSRPAGSTSGSPLTPAQTSGRATAEALPASALSWPNTDFSRHTVPFAEIISGCPGPDCIPALDAAGATSIPSKRVGKATFAPVSNAAYAPQFPVAVVSVGPVVRGYPLHILTWHEIVNDRFGEVPVAVTFCPLCNTALAFDRRVGDKTLDFGVSGNLRKSDLIMWDRQTESWWQQATGEGIVGTLAGTSLKPIPVSVVSFGDFARSFPSAEILTEDTGVSRDYGINPYEGYDASGSTPFLFNGTIDRRLDALERVVALGGPNDFLAVPFGALAEHAVANVTAGGERLVVLWAPGTVSALDGPVIARSRDIGAAAAYVAQARGRQITLAPAGPGVFRDDETGSAWDITGLATAGPLAGERLAVAVHTVQFWFAWAAFHPDTAIWQP